ncbi:hypothetical protein RJ55_07030 [Drechmeria coniospora]|nr:hypothetical protein RJ55_07030 [Drechmeria coniospora]
MENKAIRAKAAATRKGECEILSGEEASSESSMILDENDDDDDDDDDDDEHYDTRPIWPLTNETTSDTSTITFTGNCPQTKSMWSPISSLENTIALSLLL